MTGARQSNNILILCEEYEMGTSQTHTSADWFRTILNVRGRPVQISAARMNTNEDGNQRSR